MKRTSISNTMSKEIPVIAAVDVVVLGGTVAGVAAAESAAGDEADVFLVAPRLYLGEDLCATLRLAPDDGRTYNTRLERRLFEGEENPTPAGVKAILAETLLDAGVDFMLASYACDLLRDENGLLCGVVVASRHGRAAILANALIDATTYADVCRRAGCEAEDWQNGIVRFERVVLREDGANQETAATWQTQQIDIPMPDFSYASLAEAEQLARDRTYGNDVLRGAESLFCVPPNPIRCRWSSAAFSGGEPFAVEHFQPRDEKRLYVLSGCADVPRDRAEQLLKPAAMTQVAIDIGRAAAAEAAGAQPPRGVHVARRHNAGEVTGDIREPHDLERNALPGVAAIFDGDSALPVLAEVDVLVVGGGTAGAPAAIAAGRCGARTLVVEYQEGLGGVGTLGLIGKPYHGKRAGFSQEVPFPESIENKMEWYRREIRKTGGTIWLGAIGCGAVLEGNRITGAVVCTPEKRGIVRAAVVIDATGNADIAAGAGAECMFGTIEQGDIALQGAGLPARPLRSVYQNTDYLLIDETDATDVWRANVSVQLKHRTDFDVGTLLQTRERRRIVGDFTMRYIDQIAGRTYPDSVVFSGSDYDSHGYPSSAFFALLPHDAQSRAANHPAPGGVCFTPYRCLLPRGLEGILVVGIGISMDRDASALVRMQLDLANQGYAAGVAAALAAREKTALRKIDVRNLQRHLVETGCLPQDVLTHEDSFPLPMQTVRQAVDDFGEATNPAAAGEPLAIILTHPQIAQPLLKTAFAGAEGQTRLAYAQVLAVLGERCVVPELIAALGDIGEWDAKIFQGAMAEYAHLPTPIDSVILALGYAGDRAATPAILRMLDMLDANVTLSHHRAAALALERLADPAAAQKLAALLKKPGMTGHVLDRLPTHGAVENRTESLREIILARALYHCGDFAGLGRKILTQYCRDIRGLFARHAAATLGKKQ